MVHHHIPDHELSTFDGEWRDWDGLILNNGPSAKQRTETGILLKRSYCTCLCVYKYKYMNLRVRGTTI